MDRLNGGGWGTSPFPPIAEYAFLSDCQTCALVAPSGNVEWLCLPRFDSPSVFGAILDRGAGMFRLGPDGVAVPAARRYLPGTMVLETSWGAPGGWIIVRDVLLIGPVAPRGRASRTRGGGRRPTTTPSTCCSDGALRERRGAGATSTASPRSTTAASAATWEYDGAGYHEAVARAGGVEIELPPDHRHAGRLRRPARDRPHADEGGRHAVRRALLVRARRRHDATRRRTSGSCGPRITGSTGSTTASFPDHPWRTYLQRSALTLKGLTYEPTGALVAAATTSLPETPGGERNWDYRYTWIRDATFMLWGLYTLGFDWEANDFFYFLAELAEAEEGSSRSCTGSAARRELPERTLDHLSGYEGARPVRVGNDAYRQDQHDVWGAILDSFYLHTKSRDHLPERIWPMLVEQVEAALDELARARPRHLGGARRAEALHLLEADVLGRGRPRRAAGRDPRRPRVRGALAVGRRRDPRRHLRQRARRARRLRASTTGPTALDASVLLMPLVRFLPPDDARIRETVLAIADELTVDGLVLRYRTEETDDGLSGDEGTFTICSFWLVSALVEIGEVHRARDLCEKLLSYASPLQLYAEEIDPRQRTAPRELPAGVHPPRADQRGDARDPRRAGRRDRLLPSRARVFPPGRRSLVSQWTGLRYRRFRPVSSRSDTSGPATSRGGLSCCCTAFPTTCVPTTAWQQSWLMPEPTSSCPTCAGLDRLPSRTHRPSDPGNRRRWRTIYGR